MTVFAAVSVLQVDKDDSKSYNKSLVQSIFLQICVIQPLN